MPLINTSVPNLIQGVSQQPAAVRYDGQCEEQENALSSVVEGLKKRPNTRHIARLIGNAITADSFVHFIHRSDTEKYVVIIDMVYGDDDNDPSTPPNHIDCQLRIFNIITGQACTIGSNNATVLNLNGTGYSYLHTSNPRELLKALTVADNTFILNTDSLVALSPTYTDEYEKEAIIFIKQGAYNQDYSFKVEGDFSTGGGTGTTAQVSATYNRVSDNNDEWYLASVSVTNGGSAYVDGQTINVDHPSTSSDFGTASPFTYGGYSMAVVTEPTINWSINSSGTITGGTVVSGGSFTLSRSGGPAYANMGHMSGTFTKTGRSLTSPTGTVATSAPKEISITNGNNNANADTIMGLLVAEAGTTSNFPNITSTSGTVNADFELVNYGNFATLTRQSGKSDFKISTKDDNFLGVVYKEVASISDLPSYCKNGFKVKIRGDAELAQDDYYVVFETTSGQTVGNGTWVETAAPSIRNGVLDTTMPIVLKSPLPNHFTLSNMTTARRTCGDDQTNPLPSFAGQRIQNLFFFKNRLGFLSSDNVVLSESGLGSLNSSNVVEFNFSRTTVSTLLDSDPIDVAVASSRVTNLLAARGFQENLVLFAEQGQFVMKSGDVLTPKTVSITPITNFDVESAVDPIPVGSYIYFPFTRGNFAGLREFTVDTNTDNYDSVDVTEHVPSYVPSNIIDMAGTTTEDIIALLSADETKTLYMYKYFWSGNKKVLSSWCKFTFSDDIRGIEFIDSTLYLVTVDTESNTNLLELPLEAGLTDIDHNGSTAGFLTLLDKRVRVKVDSGSSVVQFVQADDTYSGANTDQPYTYFNGSIPSGGQNLSEVLVDSTGTTHALKYQNIGAGGQVLLQSGNASSTLYGYVGISYTMKYKFSTQIFKAQSGNSKSPTSVSAMHVRNGSVFFSDTHKFDVKVTPEQRTTATNSFDATSRPEADTLGSLKFAEGHYKFPVYSKAKHAEIEIENSTPFDSKFTSAEFESFVHTRSQRYG